jgi:hypothetical protein
MTNGTIVTLKKNTVAGSEPVASSLYQAELAINTADAKIFTKRDDGTVLSQSIGTVQSGYFDADTAGVQVVDTFDAALYISAKYVVQCTAQGLIPNEVQTIEILVMHNGTDVYITRYGLMYTGSAELASFTVDKVGDDVRLKATTVNNDTMIKFTRTVVQV